LGWWRVVSGHRENKDGTERYRTIVADPPWEIERVIRSGGRRARSTEVPYAFMSIDEIKALPVVDMAADQAHLYLWSTRRLFREGIAAAVARAWGFEPCGEIIWGLRNPGMGAGFNANDHEPVLLASRGGIGWPKDERPGGVRFWRQLYLGGGKAHSAKPEAFLDWVESVSPAPRLEMFARRARLVGWDYWGDQALESIDLPEAVA
jgi:N6-adenosine-specific RNA methylase IME4